MMTTKIYHIANTFKAGVSLGEAANLCNCSYHYEFTDNGVRVAIVGTKEDFAFIDLMLRDHRVKEND